MCVSVTRRFCWSNCSELPSWNKHKNWVGGLYNGCFLKLVLCCINNSRFDETVRECMHAAIWSTEKVYRPKQIWRKKNSWRLFFEDEATFFFFWKNRVLFIAKKSQDFYALILLDSDHQFTVTDQQRWAIHSSGDLFGEARMSVWIRHVYLGRWNIFFPKRRTI